MAYFPLFVDLKNVRCLIVGGGEVSLRKAEVMCQFADDVVVVAEHVCEEIRKLPVSIKERSFEETDLDDVGIVIAATDDHGLNHLIAESAKERKLPVNAVDQKEDCTFIFPSFLKEKDVIAAFSSSGNSPVLTQYLKKENEKIITPQLAEINDFLGEVRDTVIMSVETKRRKECFKEILDACLKQNAVITQEEFMKILETYRSVWNSK